MDTRKLGYSDLELTTLGIGTYAMGGGDWKFGWGPQDDQASITTIHQALDEGINWIDTAPIYGHGKSEELVGKAIQGIREELIIATKCGRVWEGDSREIGKSLSAASIRKEVEDSLRRLNIDVIDLYQIHWPQPDEEIEEGWSTMAELVKEGKVRYIAVSNFNVEQMKRAQAIHPIASLQPPYNMLRREIEEEIIPYCKDNAIGIVAYSAMQAGMLTGKFSKARAGQLLDTDWRRNSPFFNEPLLSQHLEIVEQLRVIASEKDCTLGQLALAWVIREQAVTSAIVGARSPEQIRETAKAGSIRLTDDEVEKIEIVLR